MHTDTVWWHQDYETWLQYNTHHRLCKLNIEIFDAWSDHPKLSFICLCDKEINNVKLCVFNTYIERQIEACGLPQTFHLFQKEIQSTA